MVEADRVERDRKRSEFHKRLRQAELLEGYSYDDGKNFVTRPYWPLEPKNKIQPHLWRWNDIRPLVAECGEMIGLGHGGSKYDRRVLALSNPGTGAEFTLSGTLFGDIQLIRPGEAAPCHRHTPCATRFILEGSGGWTSVAGKRVHVRPGDVVYTGQFPWHDHGNSAQDDFIFLDVLDIPLLFFTGTSSWEFDYEPVTGSKDNVNQPAETVVAPAPTSDLAHQSWSTARENLLGMAGGTGSPYEGLRAELTGADGGHVGQTVAVHSQWLRPRETTMSHRHTGAVIYIGVEGHGAVTIDDREFEFGPKDIFVIPSWHWHSFKTKDGCFLHSISDLPLIRKMKLYREQRRLTDGRVWDSGWSGEVPR